MISEFSLKKERSYIRVLSVAIIHNNDKILAGGCFDPKNNNGFYRLPGGGVEFCERSKEALEREFMEEIGEKIENIELFDVKEDVFEFNGKKCHEIIFLYNCDFVNKELYKKDKIYAIEEEHKGEYFEWISPNATTLPIYPKNWDKKI